MILKYKLQYLVILTMLLHGYLLYSASNPIVEIDFASLFFEGILITAPLIGIFLIDNLKNNSYNSFYFLFVGLSFLIISMTTDTIDEVIEINNTYDVIFEGLFELLGFICLILGLHFWTQHNKKVNKKLNKIAGTDYLTGICNRRSFMNILEENIELEKKERANLSIILLDIDNFKKINDNYGHDVGDIVLLNITNLVSKNIKKEDIFARYGGEEFVLLLPNTKISDATIVAQKLCKIVENCQNMPTKNSVTASFGVTCYINDETVDNLLKRADSAMYEAKKSGKNRVISYEN